MLKRQSQANFAFLFVIFCDFYAFVQRIKKFHSFIVEYFMHICIISQAAFVLFRICGNVALYDRLQRAVRLHVRECLVHRQLQACVFLSHTYRQLRF